MANRNRNRNRRFNTAVSTPVEPTISNEEEDMTEQTDSGDIQVVNDDLTKTSPVVQTPEVAVSEEDETLALSTDPQDDDDLTTQRIRTFLLSYKNGIEAPGKKPEHFADAARDAYRVTKLIIERPSDKNLEILLAFFEENIETAADARHSLKGSLTLNKTEEEQVSYLWTLFSDLAHKRSLAVDGGRVLTVLKRQEILNFYNRRKEGFLRGQ